MKKSDLIAGLHVVETRQGAMYFVFNKSLIASTIGWLTLETFYDDLKSTTETIFDIVKVYKHEPNKKGFKFMDCSYMELIWERDTKPTMEEWEKQVICGATVLCWVSDNKRSGVIYLPTAVIVKKIEETASKRSYTDVDDDDWTYAEPVGDEDLGAQF